MFLFITSLALAAAASQTSAHHKMPEPKGSLAGLISSEDYPVQSLDRNEQGTVGILIRVDTTGAISDCIIEKSSGFAALDDKTCELIRQRAKFQPARDRRGRPVVSETHSHVHWAIAQDMMPSDPWALRTVIDFGTNGRVTGCRVESEGAIHPKEAKPSAPCGPEQMNRDVSRDARFGGVIRRLTMEQRFTPGPAPRQPLAPHEVVADRVVLNLEIDAAGKFKSCQVAERLGPPHVVDPCIAATKRFPPRKGPNGTAAPFSATESFTTLLLVDPRRLPLSGSLQGLISSDDYPAEALDRNEQGTVGIRLHVNAAGEVSDCVVEKSSGFAILDRTTCDLVRRRAKFEPARDRDGGPIASETGSQITWQIAEDKASSEPWLSRIIIRFGPDGRLASCRIEMEGSLRRMAGPTVPECPADALKGFPPDIAELRGSIATIVSEESFAMGHVSAPPIPAGDTLIGRVVTNLDVDADGKLTSCKVAQVNGEDLQDDPCAEIEKLYEPRLGADGKPVPFNATKIITLYAHQEKVALTDRFHAAIPR